MKNFFNKIIKLFMEGLVLILPLALTIWLILYIFRYMQNFLAKIFSFLAYYWPFLGSVNEVPYMNIGIVFVFITMLGYLASTFLIRSIISSIESLVMSIPIVSILYSSIKDSASALIDKFGNPVLINFNSDLSLQKIGFITQENTQPFTGNDKVAVYIPHSYAFSGELVLIEKKHVQYLNMSTSDALRLILSGGLANIAPSKPKHIGNRT